MTYVDWKIKAKSDSDFSKKIKDEGEQLIKKFIRALFEMECTFKSIKIVFLTIFYKKSRISHKKILNLLIF